MRKIFFPDINQIFYYSALLFAFTISLSHAAVSFFVLWFVFLFLIRKDFVTSWKIIKETRVFQVMGLFISFIFLSILWSSDIHEALNQMRLYSYWILIPILAVSLKKEWLYSIITAFLLGMFLSEVIAYGIYFDLWNQYGFTFTEPSPFMTHIHYSIFLATTTIILLNRLLSKHYSNKEKLPMLLFFMTTTINLFISNGRTGQVAFLVAIAVAVIIHNRFTIKSLLMFSLISSFLFIGSYFALPTFQQRTKAMFSDIEMLNNGQYNTSVGQRSGFWIVTYDILKESPLFGVGIGDYKHAAKKVLTKNTHGLCPDAVKFCSTSHYHNQHLMILAQSGLIGFALMIWLYITIYQIAIKDKELKEVSVLTLTVFIVSAFSEPLWMLQFPIILFIFIVSVSLIAAKQENELI